MANRQIHLRLVDGLGLSYEPDAHLLLDDPTLDPALWTEWQILAATFPGVSLQPTYSRTKQALLTDILDAVRMRGYEPPDLLASFTVTWDESEVDALAVALRTLPFVSRADVARELDLTGVVSWGTNTESQRQFQVQPNPVGVDAWYGWHVAGGLGEGVHVADMGNAWNLDHEDFLGQPVHRLWPDTSTDPRAISHGTATAGIVAARDNGHGIVGIAPRARVTVVPSFTEVPDEIIAALDAVKPGGVIVVEFGPRFGTPPRPGALPMQADRESQEAMLVATFFGVTVVDGAGNGHVQMDTAPGLEHIQPGKPGFVNAGVVTVGGGERIPTDTVQWKRADFSSFGAVVDCFAAGRTVRSPAGSSPTAYRDFRGTSASLAIIGGLVASMQGMSLAARDDFLLPSDIRRLLRDPRMGVPTVPPTAGIGRMPSLREIARKMEWPLIVPAALVATGADSLVLAHLDADLHLVRRHWSFFGGWGPRLSLSSGDIEVLPQQLALTTGVSDDHGPITDVAANLPDGVHYLWWAQSGAAGLWDTPRTPRRTLAPMRSVASVRASAKTLTVVGINPDGQLAMVLGDLADHIWDGFGPPHIIDVTTLYFRPSDPVAVSRKSGVVDVVMITDTGSLVWYTGPDTFGSSWTGTVFEENEIEFVPTARPGVVVSTARLDVLTVGADGWLYWTWINTITGSMSDPEVIDTQVTVSGDGPVALVRRGQRLVALAVDTDGPLRVAHKDPGAAWTSLASIDDVLTVSPLGGVSAVILDAIGIVAAAIDPIDGRPRWTISKDGADWSPPAPIEVTIPIL